jgi:hypothetical protein
MQENAAYSQNACEGYIKVNKDMLRYKAIIEILNWWEVEIKLKRNKI